ncbi:MAG TPA: class I SAM-dependent methyltransferase [Candidatus Acidoferrum sp.]|nr:class I SAM-dependent methyltransferase [Candidatus Acidoferrum sp.]
MPILDSNLPTEGEITHVSDTALMVAACRAHENELEDAFVRDPFAARLAGERGVAILNALTHANVLRIGIAIRTRFVDELLLEALAKHPVATVLSVGCGLDTRPWRLDLSPNLLWIEADFADVLDYKERLMSGERPRCRREYLTVDLNDAAQRRVMYEAAGASPALMITEGLLLYLPAATVDALAAEASSHSGIAHWISDITTSAFSEVLGRGADTMRPIRHVMASDALKGEQIMEVLQGHGWKTSAMRSYLTDVGFVLDRVRRSMGGATPPRLRYPPNDPTGVHRFARS